MNKQRLEQMVVMLRGLPPEKFNIGRWHCGTSACAVGHACCSPAFQEQGLSLRKYDWECEPAFDGETSWEAVEKFFDIKPSAASYLFYDREYPNEGETTALEVADRIESFIAEHEGHQS